MAYTEFYCDASAGLNTNAGDKTANGIVTSTNGGWSTVTNIFTATGGTPFSGVAVGDFCALMADGGTVAVYISRVTAVGGGGLTLTLSTTAKSGTAPTTAGVGITATTGGAWKGPNGSSGFPFSLSPCVDGLVDSSSHATRINMKNGTSYSVTAAVATVTRASNGMVIQGYTSAVGDGGRFILDGGATGTSYDLFTLATTISRITDGVFQNNGNSGTSKALLRVTSASSELNNIIVANSYGNGFHLTSANNTITECEAYNCNLANTAAQGGFAFPGATAYIKRCISHDNAGSNTFGFGGTGHGAIIIEDSIADTNGGVGFSMTAAAANLPVVSGCDAYNNGSSGAVFSPTNSSFICENSNFVKNGAYGVNCISAQIGRISNCGFGSGTQVNTSGQTNIPTITSIDLTGSITYASGVTPWVDPANGDFRINLAAAQGTGRGTFVETAASYAGTIGYPDVGSAQHQDSGGGGAYMAQIGGGITTGVG